MPYNQVDPQNFNFLGRYMQGQQQARENKLQDQQENRQSALFDIRKTSADQGTTLFNNALDDRKRQIDERQIQESLSKIEWALSISDKDTIASVLPDAVKHFEGKYGPGSWAAAPIDAIHQDAQGARIQLASALRQGPSQAKESDKLYKLASGNYATPQDAAGQPFFNDPNQPTDAPARQREYEYYQNLSEEQKQEYDRMNRGYSGAADLQTNEFGKVRGREDAAWLEAFPKAEKGYQTAIESNKNTDEAIDRALSGANYFTVGVLSGVKSVSGTPQKDLASNIVTIKANIGFDRLQKMRMESPTGGALGQVAVQELEALQNSIASLDQSQSKGQFVESLKIVKARYAQFTSASKRALASDRARATSLRKYYGGQTNITIPDGDAPSPQGGPASETGGAGTGQTIRKYNPETGKIE